MSSDLGTRTTLRSALEAVADRLDRLDGVKDPRPSVDLLAAVVLGVEPGNELGGLDRPPTAREQGRIDGLIRRVEQGEPIAYVLGFSPFCGRIFEVSRGTLIPRRDTEELVRIVLDDVRARPLPDRPLVLELCCGSGCVAITLADRLPGADVVATDLSGEALAVADRNVRRHGMTGRIRLGQGDLAEPAARIAAGRRFDLIVSNPPYIPSGGIEAMGPAVAGHEPLLALDGGADGLDFHRRILDEARLLLSPGGRVFLEHEHDQGESAVRVAHTFGSEYEDIRVLRDSGGRDRVLAARLGARVGDRD
ncbi:peptide chain release factor N(5)-glutamine methyltransferase [Tautonia plasticadhaerens]|uniref:Release factor glutamine methyltransferase n=1 Tax=Tautonia plasticadhaerens TaxID=2527974 RepID=A0A518HB51_9BACT|nr:peptide chain release factor N(5)-glutamine methyltransferase [Tautonia plasticadhaerens]QDV38051.1 50S ribosomal protein L3 glutamine methyltransferase [Tautonia plasticadhaerens]